MIKSSSLSRLGQLDFFQVISNILAFLQAADLTALQLQKVYDELLAAFNAYDEAIIQTRKTGLTDPLAVLDSERDQSLSGFNDCLKGYSKLLVPAKAAAAKALLTILEKYPYIQGLPSRDETAAIINLLHELKTPERTADTNLLGLTDFVTVLEEKNTAYQTTYNQRTEKEAQYQVEAAKTTRLATELAFRNVVNAINGLEAVFGEEAYRTLSDQINREVGRAKQ